MKRVGCALLIAIVLLLAVLCQKLDSGQVTQEIQTDTSLDSFADTSQLPYWSKAESLSPLLLK